MTVQPLDGALRRYDPAAARLALSETLPRESRGFHMAFQLALLEAREAVEAVLADASRPRRRPAMLIRVGLLNYVAGALLMPYAPFLDAARALRHDMEALAARFGVSFEQACHRLSTLQRQGARGVPFFFLRVDPAGNVSQAVLGGGVSVRPLRWVVPALGGAHGVRQPGVVQVQVAELPDGAAFLCFARTVHAAGARLGRAAADACRGDGLRRWRMPTRWSMPTGWTWSGRGSASACPAGCATGRTAAAGPSRRWSTGWRSTRNSAGVAPYRFETKRA